MQTHRWYGMHLPKAEMLDQWVAPKPWTSKTKFMDYNVGAADFIR
jgi:hypothetical protein